MYVAFIFIFYCSVLPSTSSDKKVLLSFPVPAPSSEIGVEVLVEVVVDPILDLIVDMDISC